MGNFFNDVCGIMCLWFISGIIYIIKINYIEKGFVCKWEEDIFLIIYGVLVFKFLFVLNLLLMVDFILLIGILKLVINLMWIVLCGC